MEHIFVWFEGGSDIVGETRDEVWSKKSPKAIEVSSFSHQIVQPKSANASSSGNFAAQRADHGEMIFTKAIDAATPKLLQACSAGTIYPKVTVSFNRAFGGQNKTSESAGTPTRVEYLKVELRNVIVSTVASNVSSVSELPTETFGLKYSKIQWTYTAATIDGAGNGKAAGAGVVGKWSLDTNTVSFQ